MEEKTRLLIVEDEKRIARFLQMELEHEGFLAATESNGRRAYERILQENYDLVLLDLMLPEMDGLTICQNIRKLSDVPIIMLTAKTEDMDKLLGFDHGADDYLTKPFDTDELLARVGALTRRTGEVLVDTVRFEDLTLELGSAKLLCGDDSVQLSRKEFAVLKTFLYNPTMTIATDTLIANAWGIDSEATDNNVEVYISFLRKKLKYLGSRVSIRKLQRIGYRLEVGEC